MKLLGLLSSVALVTLLSVTLCNVARATPVSASMTLDAQLTIGSASSSDPQSTAWGTLLDSLSIASTATLPGGTVQGAGSASWGAGGNSGTISFLRYGWDVSAPDSSGAANLNNGSDWAYTFVADFNGHINMSYNVTSPTSEKFGLQGWDILWSGTAGDLNLANAFDPTASGVFSDAIVAGNTYTIQLRNNANISGGSANFGPSSMDGLFEFTMTADNSGVPEPGTLALLGFALAGLGVTRRRKQ